MRKELLSIGEVAAMKNISIKGLRYYEKIGILKPAYINPETGYRYYSMSQMIDIDIISTCLELDIPLKSLAKHIKPSTENAPILDLESLLLEGRAIAIDKIHRSQAALERINGAMREIEDQRSVANQPEPYIRPIEDCMLLCLPWQQKTFIGKDYVRAITSLYRTAEKYDIVPLYTQGMVHNIHPELPGWAVYVEAHIPEYVEITITKPFIRLPEDSDYYLLHLSHKTYQGHRVVRENFEDCFRALFSACEGSNTTLIASDIWSVDPNRYLVEVLEDIQ